VLIGPNGVGKTFLLQQMLKALLGDGETGKKARWYGKFTSNNKEDQQLPIANLVSVSFSAFDHFVLMPDRKPLRESDVSKYIFYSSIGLRRARNTGRGKGTPKSGGMLAREFANSAWACVNGPRLSRWHRAVNALESDSIFKDADVLSLSAYGDEKAFEKEAKVLFNSLSSGHKLVLLTITQLVETVDEQTLILFDEPEAHLHPPLLSALIRSLSDLLINRNGLAIVATHSPVVLQEVPKSCVWKLRRSGNTTIAERPEIETFGENVGVLTSDAFALEVTKSGFHTMISQVAEQENKLY
jgi:AAA domain, putative AbiEii toxin, Type IV TA system